MIKSYEDLEVYQRAYASSLLLHQVSLTFPNLEQHELARQIRRATKSIPLNIAEGYGKKASLAEFKRYLTMALGSNDEVIVQLRYCKDLDYITAEQHASYHTEHVKIGKMLRAMIQTWQ